MSIFQPALDYLMDMTERYGTVQIKMSKLLIICKLRNTCGNRVAESTVSRMIGYLRKQGLDMEFFDFRHCRGGGHSKVKNKDTSMGSVYVVRAPAHCSAERRKVDKQAQE